MSEKRIYTGSAITIQHLASLMEEHEIPVIIKNPSESARLAGFGSLPNGVELYVNAENEEKALQVVAAFEKEHLSAN
jgi:hypothetical protein